MKLVIEAKGILSGDKEIEEQFAKIAAELFVLFCNKQKNYGKGNIAQFGEKGVLIRSSDKIQRLLRMVWDGTPNSLNDESIDDTWRDLANYAIIALMCRRGVWK
jgi:hypothetical protein